MAEIERMSGPRAAKVGGMANPTCHWKVNGPRRSGEQVSNTLQGNQKHLPFDGAPPLLGLYLKDSNMYGKSWAEVLPLTFFTIKKKLGTITSVYVKQKAY